MKRMHVHVGVEDLEQSTNFYSALFAAQPTVVRSDYAKWMLDDPRVNFAISTRGKQPGLDHLGIQVEDKAELHEVYARLRIAEGAVIEQGQTSCCYAKSEKSWIDDPSGIAWEAFHTTGESTDYGDGSGENRARIAREKSCCAPRAASGAPRTSARFLGSVSASVEQTGPTTCSSYVPEIQPGPSWRRRYSIVKDAERFMRFPAGSHPKGQVNPNALRLLRRMNYDVSGMRSKSWTEFTGPGAPKLDFVFTVCDSAAAETCPVWPGQPMTAHWGVPDPAAATGNDAEINLAFADTFRMLNNRISIFVSLPLQSLDQLSLQKSTRRYRRYER